MNCKHQQAEMIGWIERAELGDGHHTAFYLMRCISCGAFTGFPGDNFDDAVRAGWQVPGPEKLKILRKPDPKEWMKIR